jgi:hypothetical protein
MDSQKQNKTSLKHSVFHENNLRQQKMLLKQLKNE